jgi:hypothetical protein
MDRERPFFFKQALSDALIYALVLILFSIAKWGVITHVEEGFYINAFLGIAFIPITIGLAIFFTKRYRDTYLEGFIDFRTVFNFVMVLVLAGSGLRMMYDYVFLTYIEPDFIERSLEVTQKQISDVFAEKGLSVNDARGLFSFKSEDIPTASQSAKGSGSLNLLWGLVIALISGAVCVRKTTGVD